MKDGNDGGGYVKGPFEDGDYFTVTAIGHAASGEEVGRSTFYLADYRDGKSSVVILGNGSTGLRWLMLHM